MIGGAAVGGEIGAVGDIDIVPKLVGSDIGWGWWSNVTICPRIVTGGWSDGLNVMAHVESSNVHGKSGIRAG